MDHYRIKILFYQRMEYKYYPRTYSISWYIHRSQWLKKNIFHLNNFTLIYGNNLKNINVFSGLSRWIRCNHKVLLVMSFLQGTNATIVWQINMLPLWTSSLFHFIFISVGVATNLFLNVLHDGISCKT